MIFNSNAAIGRRIERTIKEGAKQARENLSWIGQHLPTSFLASLGDEPQAAAVLAASLHTLVHNRRLILADREDCLIQALVNCPGTLANTLRTLHDRQISFAEFGHSDAAIPGLDATLEIQRFVFGRTSWQDLACAPQTAIPAGLKASVTAELKRLDPEYAAKKFDHLLRILWVNNENYVRGLSPEEVARILHLFRNVNANSGIHVSLEEMADPSEKRGFRVRFGVHNPPQRGFLLQVMEVFRQMVIPVDYACCITLSAEFHPIFLADFHIMKGADPRTTNCEQLFKTIQTELFNTQILSIHSPTYAIYSEDKLVTGDEASLIDAFAAFCHTTLAHTHPDSFDQEGVTRAFHAHLDITRHLVKLFMAKFDPDILDRQELFARLLEEATHLIDSYNTGRRFLDEFRRVIFRCCLSLIRNTVKTNYFVVDKQALSFRIDPAYLDELDRSFTADLPAQRPFRVTFFYSRYGVGYHVGFSDIARGGWRTVITHGRDDYVTAANTVFREVYVLAHTQHLKNKDIYQGGSKLVAVLASGTKDDPEATTWGLYKLQWSFINAFLDIIITTDGQARHPRVVDYYQDDEPIEIGPDENMHDLMIEAMARLSKRRGYILGIGIMSSKQVGIGHKEYGVTSIGVFTFAEVVMRHLGLDVFRDPFTVKLTGGPNGDVAGNTMRLILERCPKAKLALILDGTAALHDPMGADPAQLKSLLMREDLAAFDPQALNPGGFILYRNVCRMDGLQQLHKRLVRRDQGLEEQWVSEDDCNREFNDLIFSVPTDLFIPCGGRPETVTAANWKRFLRPDGSPTMRAVVEGANSYVTPEARTELQGQGVIIMRDASANKCGVICSSYEIIANLLLSEKEFLASKERYVADVIAILEKRAADEARLVFKRHDAQKIDILPYTEISERISREINAYYARLFAYFQNNPQLCRQPAYRAVIRRHLPRMIGTSRSLFKRVFGLMDKYLSAILAAEIATSIVYGDDKDADIAGIIWSQLKKAGSGV